MDINFELYKVFYHAALYQNFSKAANELYVSQSSISQSIKSLETKLSIKLFSRNAKQIKLTKEGEMLFEYVSRAYNELKLAEKQVESLLDYSKGKISIGVSDTISKYFLIKYLKAFHELYPNINIEIINRPSSYSMNEIKNGSIDLALVNLTKEEKHNDLTIKSVISFKDVFVSSEKYKHIIGASITKENISEIPIISLEKNSSTRRFFDSVMDKYGLSIEPEIEVGSIDLIFDLVSIGLGIGFVPDYAVPKDTSLFVLNSDLSFEDRDISIVTNKTLHYSLVTEKFIELF